MLCDVCEKSQAIVICCAAALCAKCDVEVHAANKLASKHQRLLLQSLSNKLPSCDICREQLEFGELEWFTDIGDFNEKEAYEPSSATEVPQLPLPQSSNATLYKTSKLYMPYKKQRIKMGDDKKEYFIA